MVKNLNHKMSRQQTLKASRFLSFEFRKLLTNLTLRCLMLQNFLMYSVQLISIWLDKHFKLNLIFAAVERANRIFSLTRKKMFVTATFQLIIRNHDFETFIALRPVQFLKQVVMYPAVKWATSSADRMFQK
jgi:hypothetical protein